MSRETRPTLADVARAAGVSRALVSIVIRGAEGASPATREKVLAAARELGYRPDARARLLRSRRTRLLGVTFHVAEPFHGELVEEIYRAAEAEGYEVALSAVAPSRTEARAVDSLKDFGCEALLMIAPAAAAEQLGSWAASLPLVSLLRTVEAPGVDSVRSDEDAGIGQVMEHLAALGHRRIVHIDGGGAVAAEQRRQAYLRKMQERGLADSALVIRGGLAEEDGIRAARELLAALPPSGTDSPTAVVVFNDRCALGVLDELLRRGIRVPEQLSVAGYDDSRLARLGHVGLTSVSQNGPLLAGSAVKCAIARLNSAEPAGLLGAPQLQVRSTTAPPAAAPLTAADLR